jgi:hypothetical protein
MSSGIAPYQPSGRTYVTSLFTPPSLCLGTSFTVSARTFKMVEEGTSATCQVQVVGDSFGVVLSRGLFAKGTTKEVFKVSSLIFGKKHIVLT